MAGRPRVTGPTTGSYQGQVPDLQPLIDAEVRQMAEFQIGLTRSRSLLASMYNVAISGRTDIQLHPEWSLLGIEHTLAIMPCGPLGMRSPAEAAAVGLTNRHAKWG